jgi:hypothetical protein
MEVTGKEVFTDQQSVLFTSALSFLVREILD